MSKKLYRKGKWPINTSHGWKIRAATKATEDPFAACPNVTVKIGDVEIDLFAAATASKTRTVVNFATGANISS